MDRMMAELYAKVTGACKGKGGSMHIADFSVGMLGANGVVGGGANLAVGATIAARLRGHGPDRGLLLRGWRLESRPGPRGDEPGGRLESAGHLLLREQPVRLDDLGQDGDEDRGHRGSGGGVRDAGHRGGRQRRGWRSTARCVEWVERATKRRRPGPDRGEDVPDARPLRGRSAGVPRCLPRWRPSARTTRSSGSSGGCSASGCWTRTTLERMRAEVEEELAAAVQFGRESPLPEPEEALEDLYATPPHPSPLPEGEASRPDA